MFNLILMVGVLLIVGIVGLVMLKLRADNVVGEKYNRSLRSASTEKESIEIQNKAAADHSSLMKKYMLAFGVVYAIFGVLFFGFISFTQIPASHAGVVSVFGEVRDGTLNEGAHIINPMARVTKISLGLDTVKVEHAEAASKDLQTIQTSITVNYKIDPTKVRELYVINPNMNYEQQYVGPAIVETLKAVASEYTAEQLVSKRTEVSTKIQSTLAKKLTQYHLQVQDINITNFAFSKTFNDAIEAKVKATQEAERAGRDLDRIKFEAEQKIVTANAQAKAIRIQAEAVNAAGGEGYVKLEAIKRWDGKLPMVTGGSTPFIKMDMSAPAAK